MSSNHTRTRAFGSPSRYIQGNKEFDRIEYHINSYGKNAFILIDAFLFKNLKSRIDNLYENSKSTVHYEEFNGECSYNEVDRINKLAVDYNADVIIGIGGGKVLDTVKVVADRMALPLIIVPTSASCDAPTSAMSVMYTDEGVYVHNIRHKKNPDLVLIDTAIIAEAPVRLFVAGMGDALSTIFEANANNISDSKNYVGKGYRRCKAAMALAELSFDILMEDGLKALRAVENKACTDAVENVIEANILLSGLGFENTGCAAAHAIHAGLTELSCTHEFLHGEKVAFGVICQMIMENIETEIFEKVIKFNKDVGLPITLGDLNVETTQENVMKIADKVVNNNKLIYAEPFDITIDFVYNAIIAADSLGKYYKNKSM